MGWDVLIPLIVNQGVPLAEKLWQLWSNHTVPTQADWDQLKALGAKTARSQLIDALNRAAVPLDSPAAIALLAQVP